MLAVVATAAILLVLLGVALAGGVNVPIYGELGTPGAFGWGSAYFPQYLVDPKERIVGLLMTQLRPTGVVEFSAGGSGAFESVRLSFNVILLRCTRRSSTVPVGASTPTTLNGSCSCRSPPSDRPCAPVKVEKIED